MSRSLSLAAVDRGHTTVTVGGLRLVLDEGQSPLAVLEAASAMLDHAARLASETVVHADDASMVTALSVATEALVRLASAAVTQALEPLKDAT